MLSAQEKKRVCPDVCIPKLPKSFEYRAVQLVFTPSIVFRACAVQSASRELQTTEFKTAYFPTSTRNQSSRIHLLLLQLHTSTDGTTSTLSLPATQDIVDTPVLLSLSAYYDPKSTTPVLVPSRNRSRPSVRLKILSTPRARQEKKNRLLVSLFKTSSHGASTAP